MARREARIESGAAIVCERCVVADSFLLRLLGLLGRRGIAPDEGLLLIGSASLHTTFMRFPIDAVFLDRELTVIDVVPVLRPWRFSGRRNATHILELRAGEAALRDLHAGVRLQLIEPATAPVAPRSARREDGRERSIRVVLGASDRRFLRVASFLLGRNGFSVSSATGFAALMGAVEHGNADVVVLDASGPRRWTLQAAAALEAQSIGVPLLVVADEPGSIAADTLPKWGSFDRLVDEIRRRHGRSSIGAMPA
jgi:uncharacterized protein